MDILKDPFWRMDCRRAGVEAGRLASWSRESFRYGGTEAWSAMRSGKARRGAECGGGAHRLAGEKRPPRHVRIRAEE